MTHSMKKFLIHLVIFLMLVMPALSSAATLVPCNNNTKVVDGVAPTPCDFKAFMDLINNGIDYILKFLAIPIAAIMFFYAGFLMVTSGGSTESKTRAKSIFTNAALGLIFIAGAWIIIKTILTVLRYDGAWIGF